MIARASANGASIQAEIQSGRDHTWNAVRHLVAYLNQVRGTTGYHQLRVLTRLQRRPGMLTIENIQRVAPYIHAADSTQLLLEAGRGGSSFGTSTPIDNEVVQFILTNGAYADLALDNELHFSPTFFPPDAAHTAGQFPGNWPAFETAHAAALEKIDALAAASGRSTSSETGPIPADAIAQLAHGFHFLTDAFSSGHMRVPRHQLGRHGSLLSGVMHDVENDLGLTVTNGFNDRWHAFGDQHLERSTQRQLNLLAELAAASRRSGRPIDANFNANRDHAFNAVTAAVKQLHYQAQKYFGDASHSTQYQEILRNNRGTTSGLAHDDILSSVAPGDGSGRDAWLATDIPAKIAYMRKHRPVPLLASADWRRTGTSNYPPLVSTDPSGLRLQHNHQDYALDQALLSDDHVLYQMVLNTAPDFAQDITKYTLLAVLTPASAEAWAGRNTREQFLQHHIELWPDHRGFVGTITRWAERRAGLHLP
jgi:hypothetical protein